MDLNRSRLGKILEVFLVALKLGISSFGGPLAHIGYFRAEYVQKRRWLDEQSFLDLTALCQFLPGPSSSQLGIGIGTLRAGLPGGLVAWLGFTLPSALIMAVFALCLGSLGGFGGPWVHGLKIVALAIVFQAVLGMWKSLINGRVQASIAIAAFALSLAWTAALSQLLVIALAGFAGFLFVKIPKSTTPSNIIVSYKPGLAIACLILFTLLLVSLPVISQLNANPLIGMTDQLYRSGALVFGGGHVMLPLLQQQFVQSGQLANDWFLAGYGAAQALPGPLFTLSAFIGASLHGPFGALIALTAIFLPAYLLIIGVLPFWAALRAQVKIQGVFAGIGAGVVGLLLAALYNPLWTSAIAGPGDLILAAVLAGLVLVWKCPPIFAVLGGVAGAYLIEILKSSHLF